MTTTFVCNASPLIGFERLGQFDIDEQRQSAQG